MIDDVSLARAVKPVGPIQLSVSRSDVVSLREHDCAASGGWCAARAFTELRHSWALLALTLALLVLLFPLPPILTVVGFADGSMLTGAAAAGAWGLITALYLPTTAYLRLNPAWTLTLPVAGVPLRRDDGRLGPAAPTRVLVSGTLQPWTSST